MRSYKLEKTNRRGFKEESFQESIACFLGNDFTVLGKARLNTGIATQPFEPDVAIIYNLNKVLRLILK